MKALVLTLCFFSLFSAELIAQAKLDQLIEAGKNDYAFDKFKEGVVKFKEALAITDSTADLKKRMNILELMNACYKKMGYIDSAIYYNLQGIETAERLRNDTLLGAAYFNQGLNYKSLSNYQKTNEYYTKALKLFKKINLPSASAALYNSLGNLERERKKFKHSIDYHLEAIKLRISLDDPYELSKSYTNIANTFIDSGAFAVARGYLFQAISLKEQVDKSTGTANNLIGISYLREAIWDSAYYYLNKGLEKRKQANNPSKLITSYKSLGELYIDLGQPEIAERYLDSAHTIAAEISMFDELIEIIEFEVMIEKGKLAPLKIIDKYEELQLLKDSLSIEENAKHLISLNLEYDVIAYQDTIGTQMNEILIRKAENETLALRNILLTAGVIALFLFVFIIIYFLVRLRKSQKETALKNEELIESKAIVENLHEELSHRTGNYYEMFRAIFKYDRKFIDDPKMIQLLNNYINRVNAMSQIQRYLLESEVKTSTVQLNLYLSNLLTNIQNALINGENIVTIKEELETIKCDYDKALRLGLVMNEIVSNAFEHGFVNRKNPTLSIQLYENQYNQFILIISDNGVGIKDLEKFKTSSKGIGLIEMILKSEKGEATFDSERDQGTTVTISMPK